MKRSEAIKKIREIDYEFDVEKHRKLREIEKESDVANRNQDKYRARSITVGTSFGGTTEIGMRTASAGHSWCVMQPVEVVELIHQLAANVGCTVELKTRQDFASWREWRVSEAEKKHLQKHPPFVNDMAVSQKLGTSGYDFENAHKLLDQLAMLQSYANENDETGILNQGTKEMGAPQVMFGVEDGLIHNKVALNKHGEVVYMAGGNGGNDDGKDLKKDTGNEQMATKKTVNRRSSK